MVVDKNPHHRAVPESYESDTLVQREDSREIQKRASRGPQHAAFSDCREAQFCLAWGGEAMLARGEVRTRGTHTAAARFVSLYLWGNEQIIQGSAIKSVQYYRRVLKFLLTFEFCHSRKLLVLHITLVSAMTIKHPPPEFFYEQ